MILLSILSLGDSSLLRGSSYRSCAIPARKRLCVLTHNVRSCSSKAPWRLKPAEEREKFYYVLWDLNRWLAFLLSFSPEWSAVGFASSVSAQRYEWLCELLESPICSLLTTRCSLSRLMKLNLVIWKRYWCFLKTCLALQFISPNQAYFCLTVLIPELILWPLLLAVKLVHYHSHTWVSNLVSAQSALLLGVQ